MASITEDTHAFAQQVAIDQKAQDAAHTALATLVNGGAADLSALVTTDKDNLVAALNEVSAAAAAATGIDDGTTGTGSTWSSTQIQAAIDAAKNAILGGADSAHDTLLEIQNLLNTDEGAITAINTVLAKTVRTDTVQAFTAAEKAQAIDNIGAISAADVAATYSTKAYTGEPAATDFLATYNAAKA